MLIFPDYITDIDLLETRQWFEVRFFLKSKFSLTCLFCGIHNMLNVPECRQLQPETPRPPEVTCCLVVKSSDTSRPHGPYHAGQSYY